MDRAKERRVFTAELQRLRLETQRSGVPAFRQPTTGGDQPSNAEVMEAILGLRQDIKAIMQFLNPDAVSEQDEKERAAQEQLVPKDLLEKEKAEVILLRTELRALANSIQHTKAEIAALRPHESDEDRLIAVTHELDAIVTATERATQTILDAAERIDSLTSGIQSHQKDNFVKQLADEIREHVITVFEACNFQDITGQRITKVVNTLKYVEDRINAMIDIWGAETFSDLPVKPVVEERDEEAKLLNGPQLENKGISQEEIDKLFG